MEILKHTHSGLRWIALALLLAAIFNALASKGKGRYEKKDKMLNLFTMIVLHILLVIGLVLYFISPKVVFVKGWMVPAQSRFFGLEHILIMVIAIAVITIGRGKAERATIPAKKHKYIINWFIIGLILILAGIPWPFRHVGIDTWF